MLIFSLWAQTGCSLPTEPEGCMCEKFAKAKRARCNHSDPGWSGRSLVYFSMRFSWFDSHENWRRGNPISLGPLETKIRGALRQGRSTGRNSLTGSGLPFQDWFVSSSLLWPMNHFFLYSNSHTLHLCPQMSLLHMRIRCVVVSVSGFFLPFDLTNATGIWELFVVNSCCVQKHGCMDWGLLHFLHLQE